jgi:hypothetical protein
VKDSFDVLNDIFDKFIADPELPGIIGITDITDMAQCSAKFRRSFEDMTVITPEEANSVLNFVDFSFIPSHSETNNWLVNKESLEFNIYVSNVNESDEIYKAIKRIFRKYYREWRCTSPCQAGCPIPGILRYRFIAKPLVSS